MSVDRVRFLSVLASIAWVSVSAGVRGQCEALRIGPDDLTTSPEFGFSVATDGDLALIGAPRDGTLGTDAGAVYISQRIGANWTFPTKLTASDGTELTYFGSSVAVDGDYFVVGAPGDNQVAMNGGAAYVFQRQGADWIEQQKVMVNGLNDETEFGLSVGLDGNLLAIGARTDAHGTSSGSVFVFRLLDGVWTFETELFASDAGHGQRFGDSVAVSGNAVAVGAKHNDAAGTDAGAAYVFRDMGNTWVEESRLLAAEAEVGDEFGISVALDGGYLAVGARLADLGPVSNTGAVFVFHRKGNIWVQEARLTAADGEMNDQLGISVGIAGNHIIAGAWQDADAGRNTGAAYVFERKGLAWTHAPKLTNSIPSGLDEFGFAVGMGGNFAVVGIPGDDGIGQRSGTATIFATGGDCNQNGSPDACDILEGLDIDDNGDGIPDNCPAYGDFDSDGDIDLFDMGRFQNCFTGANGLIGVGCTLADVEPDDDADLVDFAQIVGTVNGP